MAKLKDPPYVKRLEHALVDGLKAVSISAEVFTENVPTTKLYRVTVVAKEFKNLKHSERQSLVWRIADRALSPEEQLHVSMILTLSREELDAD